MRTIVLAEPTDGYVVSHGGGCERLLKKWIKHGELLPGWAAPPCEHGVCFCTRDFPQHALPAIRRSRFRVHLGGRRAAS